MEVDPPEHDKLVGAYLYLWYGGPRGEGWVRDTPAEPVLGEYISMDQDVVDQQIAWAVNHGINWFLINWAAPGGYEDRAVQEVFLESDLSGHIDFSLLMGFPTHFRKNEDNLFDMGLEGNRRKLGDTFTYFQERYFPEQNYLRINGRPVVYTYGSDLLSGDIEGAFEEAKSAIEEDPYLVADPHFGKPAAEFEEMAHAYDAVSDYNLYRPEPGVVEDFNSYAEDRNTTWFLASDDFDVDVIPMVLPGYNHNEYKGGNDPIIQRSPERFREMCRDTIGLMDPELDAVLVTSFNEWPEYTAIEPAESYGTTYLEIVEEELVRGEPDYVDRTDFVPMTFDFNKTIEKRQRNSDIPEGLSNNVSLQTWRLAFRDPQGETVAEYNLGFEEDEPAAFTEGVYGPAVYDSEGEVGARNLGGVNERGTLYIDPSDAAVEEASEAVVWGKPWPDQGLEADVYFDYEGPFREYSGEPVDRIEFGPWDPGALERHVVRLE